MKLEKQCEKLSIELRDISLKYSGKPEPAVLQYYEKQGYVGSFIEGALILNVLKALMLEKLIEHNIFEDRDEAVDDACGRYLKAQLFTLGNKISETIFSIKQTTKDEFINNKLN